MQRDLVILSSSPRQPTLENGRREVSYSQSSPPTSYLGAIDKRLKSGSNASKIPEDAVTDFRCASSLLPAEDHEIPLEHLSALGIQIQEANHKRSGVAETGDKKKRTRRRKDDASANASRKKKREADKRTTADDSRPAKIVQKGKEAGRVSAYFGTGKDLVNHDGKTADVAIDLTGSPPQRRKVSWTPPKDNNPGSPPCEAVGKLLEFEYKDEVGSSSPKHCTFTISKKIEFIDAGIARNLKNCQQNDKRGSKMQTRKDPPTKRLKSITEIATEKYAEPEIASEPRDTAAKTRNGPVQSKKKTSSGSTTKSRKATSQNLTVLSPHSALERCNSQDFIFGTSSQLAGSRSPTHARSLQNILTESSKDRQREWTTSVSKVRQSGKSNVSSAPMWCVASCSPQNIVQESKATCSLDSFGRNSDNSEHRNDWLHIDDVGDSGLQKATVENDPTERTMRIPHQDLPAKQDKSHGAALRARKAPPSLHKNNRGSRETDTYSRSDEFIPIDEIEDSEPDMTPSPPRCSIASTPPLPLSPHPPPIKNSERTRNKKRPWTEEEREAAQTAMFAAITKAVKEAPRGEISEPSWHERMLMFEPVVLEDFTNCRNGAGLRVRSKDGKEEELVPWMVRGWCDNESVCCVMRLTRRQKTRKGALGEQTQAAAEQGGSGAPLSQQDG